MRTKITRVLKALKSLWDMTKEFVVGAAILTLIVSYVVAITLKAVGVITISWWIVLAPLGVVVIIAIVIAFFLAYMALAMMGYER